MSPATGTNPRNRRRHWLVFAYAIALLAVAFQMRSIIAALSPVLPDLTAELGLSEALAGASVTLPVLCFGIFSFVVPPLLRKLSPEALLTVVLIGLLAGAVWRSLGGSVVSFFAATIVIGIAVAIGNVVVPVAIRLRAPGRVALMTGLYSVMLSIGPVLAGTFTRPMAEWNGLGWRMATLAWAIPLVIVLLVWVPVARNARAHLPVAPALVSSIWPLLRRPIAWLVMVIMGLQSFGFYTLLTWLPTMLGDQGINLNTGDNLIGLLNLAAMTTSLFTPRILATRARYPALLAAMAAYVAGLGVLYLADARLLIPAVIGIGIGQGFGLAISLSLIAGVVEPEATAGLSAFAQGGGYLIAALGPSGIGLLRDMTGAWGPALWVLFASVVVFTALALIGVRELGHAARGRS